MRERRKVSVLVPYRIKDGELFVYLQKRGLNMERLPGYFAFWGGGLNEGETYEQGLVREVKEELGVGIALGDVKLLHHYEFLGSSIQVFIMEAPDDFESKLLIGEGEGGVWLSAEAAYTEKIIFESRTVINDMERVLLGKPIR